MDNPALWRYYFWHLPRLAWLPCQRYRMPDPLARQELPALLAGAAYLRQRLGAGFTTLDDAEIARRASWVRLWRESDAFASLFLNPRRLPHTTQIHGLHHLHAAAAQGRPLVLLTAHLGNPYLACASLAHSGYPVYPVARSVDHSAATPLPVQKFLHLNYWATEAKLNHGHYLYTDFAGKLDKRIVDVLQEPGNLCVNLIDLPPTLYRGKQQRVEFLNQPAALPAGFVRWALKKHALFLTFWNGYSGAFEGGHRPRRWLLLEPPIEADGVEAVLQTYAHRLQTQLAREPWQWMGLPIAAQYHAGV